MAVLPASALRATAGKQAFVDTSETADREAEGGLGRAASVAGLVAILAAVVAGAAIWLVLTDPVTVATSVEGGEISPLVRELAQVLYNAVAGLLDYL
jgi:hypothetical protein